MFKIIKITNIFIESIKLGGSFKIKWLRKSELSFNRISQYKNPLNNMEPIKKSRDTQVFNNFYK